MAVAGDWIKIEKATSRKPEVLRIADTLAIHPDHAFGLCVRFWSWCDDHMTDGHAQSVTYVTLDTVFGHAGFATALTEVGWLRVRRSAADGSPDGSLEIPNFDRHLSESAKNRALSAGRKQKQRSQSAAKDVTKASRSERDKSVTREEKRREEFLTSPTTNADDPPIVKKSKQLKAAIAHWNAYWSETHGEGRPDSPTRVEVQLSEKLSSGWDEEKIIESIHASIGWGAKSWRDPGNDFDEQAKAKANGRASRATESSADPRGNFATAAAWLASKEGGANGE